MFHIFKNNIFTEMVTSSTPFHPLVSNLQKTALLPRGLPAPPLFILLFHIFNNGMFTGRVAGSTPFHPLVSYLPKRPFHREGYRLHPFSSSCFISSKTTFSPGGYRLQTLFILLFHIFPFSPRGLPAPPPCFISSKTFKNGIFTERVTRSTPFHRLVSYLQKRHFDLEGDRRHPFSSSCFMSSKPAFSHREGYRLHPFSSSSFISSTTACSLRGLPAPPLFIFLLQSFITSKTTFSPRGLPAPPLFILLLHI